MDLLTATIEPMIASREESKQEALIICLQSLYI